MQGWPILVFSGYILERLMLHLPIFSSIIYCRMTGLVLSCVQHDRLLV